MPCLVPFHIDYSLENLFLSYSNDFMYENNTELMLYNLIIASMS